MTRGRIAIIIDGKKIVTSTEFNGNMYPEDEGYGTEVIKGLEKVKNQTDLENFVKSFNEEHFQYRDEEMIFTASEEDGVFDFSKDYFNVWFSDYIYIKNLTNERLSFTQDYGKDVDILPNEILTFYFGCIVLDDKRQSERINLIQRLCDARDSFDGIYKSNLYNNIYKICSDYDDKYNDLNLCRTLESEDYVVDSDVEDYIRKNAEDTLAIRRYFNNTTDDDLYKLDGYGQLENITLDDIKASVDNIINVVHAEILEDFERDRETNKNRIKNKNFEMWG